MSAFISKESVSWTAGFLLLNQHTETVTCRGIPHPFMSHPGSKWDISEKSDLGLISRVSLPKVRSWVSFLISMR